ncbi:MAG: amidohydrolase family protein [Methylococcaceae bacterium]|jgi:imidazolonepropionase-like amidohydrolase
MKKNNRSTHLITIALAAAFTQGASVNAYGHGAQNLPNATTREIPKPSPCRLLTAERVFDGTELHEKYAVLIKYGKIADVGPKAELRNSCDKIKKLGNATILPGFIESHAHINYQNIDHDAVLKHGITTVRDVGGPLMPPFGGKGQLRVLSSGPIIQAEGGYPLNVFGGESDYDKIGITVSSVKEAEQVVQHLVDEGAVTIKISLETGGEPGAPWMMPHGENPIPKTPWPLLSLDIVKAIVAKAEALGKKVSAHIGENKGAKLALEGGVHEWTHVPCSAIDDDLLQKAVDQGVKVVSTIDTLASCGSGLYANTMSLAKKMSTGKNGSEFIYGSEIAHDNVPWGINGEELHLMLHLTSGGNIDFPKVVNVIKSATSTAGKNLDLEGLEDLGTLKPGAPADLIAVRGNPFERFKLLEYPDLVISGGRVIVDNKNFSK